MATVGVKGLKTILEN